MVHSIRVRLVAHSTFLTVALTAVVMLAPGVVAQDAPPSDVYVMTELKSAFLGCGYAVSGSQANGLLVVQDPVDGTRSSRIVLLKVYSDAAAARLAYVRAGGSSQPPESVSFMAATLAAGPRLFAHYGPSILVNNVALSQSSTRILNGLWYEDSQTGEARVDPTAVQYPIDSFGSTSAVDLDFLSCLDQLRR